MSALDEKRLAGCLDSFDRIKRSMESELQKLCERPEMFDVAQALTDAMIGNLTYLCNYETVIAGNGKRCDIQELFDRLETDIRATFLRLTGKPYQSDVRHSLRDYCELCKGNGCESCMGAAWFGQ